MARVASTIGLFAALAGALACGGAERDAGSEVIVDGGRGGGGGGEHASPGCTATEWPASGEHAIDVDGTERTFIVRLPSDYDASAPYKMVLAWHGFTGTAAQVAAASNVGNHGRFFGLEPRAQGSTIFVAGQGLDTTLLGQTAPGWDDDGRDIAFARALLDWLRASYCVDDARVFSAGVSMGGYFSNQVGCELSDRIRAVASIIGGGPLERGVQCDAPMAAWLTHGDMDAINPFSQSERSRDHWVSKNQCASTSTPVAPATCVAYEGCTEGFPVHWCPFEGGHVIPDFAAEGMWTFFSQF